jgi:hypothetical protein
MNIGPEHTYFLLLVVQVLHLFHHRFAKRHISFVEVVAAGVLAVPPNWSAVPPLALMTAHLLLSATQVLGSLAIRRLSPDWKDTPATD